MGLLEKFRRLKVYEVTNFKEFNHDTNKTLFEVCDACGRKDPSLICITCSRFFCNHCSAKHGNTLDHTMIEVFRPENVLVPQECVSHKNSVQFYFPGTDKFGCYECKAGSYEQAIKMSAFTFENVREMKFQLKSDIEYFRSEMKASIISGLHAKSELGNVQLEIKQKFNDIHRELEDLEKKLKNQVLDALDKERIKKNAMMEEGNEYLFRMLNLQSIYGTTDYKHLNEYKIKEMQNKISEKKQPDLFWKCQPTLSIDTKRILSCLHESVQLDLLTTDETLHSSTLEAQEAEKIEGSMNITNPPSKVEFSLNEKVFISRVESPSLFYLQKAADKGRLVKLGSDLRLMKMDKLPPHLAAPGQYVYSDGLRGRIKEVSENKTETVGIKKQKSQEAASLQTGGLIIEYIDTGAISVKNMRDIYLLPREAMMEPPFAIPCSLKNIQPNLAADKLNKLEWGSCAIKEFLRLCKASDIIVAEYTFNQEVAEVDLQYPPLPEYNHHGPTRLAHILIYMELAFFKTENIAKNDYPYCQIMFNPSKDHKVQVIHVDSPSQLYVKPLYFLPQRVNRYELEKQELLQRSKTTEPGPILAPRVNEPCRLLEFTPDGKTFHRGVITKVLKGQKVEIFLVDRGQTVVIPSKIIQQINKDDLQKIPQVRKVCLADIESACESGKWKRESIGTFISIVKGRHLLMTAEAEVADDVAIPVSLYDIYLDMDVSVNALLIELKHARSLDGIHIQVKFPRTKMNELFIELKDVKKFYRDASMMPWRPLQPTTKQADQPATTPALPVTPAPASYFKVGAEIQCRITSICNPHRIFVVPEDFLGAEMAMNNEITAQVRQDGVILDNPSAGDLCLAVTPTGYTARARVLSTLPDRCSLYFLDSGTVTEVHRQQIFQYTAQYQNVPEFAVAVHLAGIWPAGGPHWSATAVEHLNNNAARRCNQYKVEVTGPAVTGTVNGETVRSFPVNLVYYNIQFNKDCVRKTISLGLKLVHMGVALKRNDSEEELFGKHLAELKSSQQPYFQPQLSGSACELAVPPTAPRNEYTIISETFHWKDTSQPLSKEFSCTASHVDQSGIVFLQSVEQHSQVLDSLSNALSSRYSGSTVRSVDGNLQPGDPVIIRTTAEIAIAGWYRGKVKTVPEMTGGKPSPSKKSKLRKRETSAFDIDGTNTKTKKIGVECVDYGNVIHVQPKFIRKHLAFTDIPLQRFRARLNCKPVDKEWSSYAINLLGKNIINQQLKATVLKVDDDGVLEVSLRLPSGRDATELLVDAQLATTMSEKLTIEDQA